MNARRGLMIVFLIAVLAAATALPVQSAALQGGATHAPWTVETFATNEPTFGSLTSSFVGPNQIPFFTYSDGFYYWIRYRSPDGTGDCGPNHEWVCINTFLPTTGEDDDVSQIAQHTYVNTFKWGFVYEGFNKKVYVYWQERMGDTMELVDSGMIQVYDLGEDLSVVGQPSMVYGSDGREHIALVIYNSITFTRSVKYIHYTSSYQTSCGFSSRYQCDTIDSGGMMVTMGSQPGIALSSTGDPRIMYYDGSTGSLMYAYPRSALFHPNCGPGGNTWRCVVITDSVQSSSDMDMAITPGGYHAQLAWTNTDSLSQTWVGHARYVGPGGNCGEDYYLTSVSPPIVALDYLWDCNQPAEIGLDAYAKYVSIQVDNQDDAVIAFNCANGMYFDLGVLYGNPDGSYDYQRVDGGHGINTGLDPALALDTYGRSFIAYVEDEEYSPNLRIAYQQSYTYLPSIMR